MKIRNVLLGGLLSLFIGTSSAIPITVTKEVYLGEFGENVELCCGPNAGSIAHVNNKNATGYINDKIYFTITDDAWLRIEVIDDYKRAAKNKVWDIYNMSVDLYGVDPFFGDEIFIDSLTNYGITPYDFFVGEYLVGIGDYFLNVMGNYSSHGGHYKFCLTTSPYDAGDRDLDPPPPNEISSPGTLALMFAGLGVLGFIRKKQ